MLILKRAALALALGLAATSAWAGGFENIVVSSEEGADTSADTFSPDVEKIYVSAKITDEVKAGSKITVSWIAVDSNGAAPPNYKIDAATFDVGSLDNHLDASLSKPNNGFPPGTYQIEVSVDGTVDETIPFTIK